MLQYINIVRTLKNAKLWVKLSAIIVLMTLPFVSLLYLFIATKQEGISTTKLERLGVEYLTPLQVMMEKLPLHRALVISPAGKERLGSLRAEIDGLLKNIEAIDERLGKRLKSTEKLQTLIRQWQQLQQRLPTLAPEPAFEQHAQVISHTINLIEHVAYTAGLTLDSEGSTYHMINLVTKLFPDLLDQIGVVRGTGVGIAARQVVTLEEQARLSIILDSAQRNMEALYRDTERIFKETSDLEKQFAPLLTPVFESADKFVALSHEQIVRTENISIAPKEYFLAGVETIDSIGKLYTAMFKALDDRLLERIDALSNSRNRQAGLALLLLLSAAGLAFWMNRLITGQTNALVSLFNEIGMGNYEARAVVTSEDELGAMTEQLNTMIDSILTLNRSVEEERDTLQGSIMKLLEEVAEVAQGDLTVQAEVTADATGAIADSFNYMIAQLRSVVTRVQEATLQVSSSANEIQTTAEHLADGSESQAAQIIDSSAAIDEMAVSIQQVSDNATLSSTVAEQAITNAKEGTQAVQNTIQGMHRIREQVQETAKRIKRLGERSQEIGEIVQLIGDIADRTSILALNASIQAARAGEAGRAFVVVAEEVERLAERSSEATKQIAGLVNTIQSETNEAVTAMEESTREVVNGSRLADQAGQTLVEIEGVSSRLAELIQSISLASKQQARGSEGLSRAMGEISEVTQQTAAGTKQAATSINNLALLADELRQSVSTFKLPAQSQHP